MMLNRAFLASAILMGGCVSASAVQNGVADIYSAPFVGEQAVTVGSAIALPAGQQAGTAPIWRGLKANCTAAGTLTYTYQDGTTGTWIVAVGSQTIPINITVLSASTATCTYAVLK